MPIDFSKRKYKMAENAVNSTRTSSFRRNDIIFREGDVGNEMYEILSGEVGIYLHYGEPDEVKVAVKYPGDFFGEVGITEKRPRTATCIAEGDEGTTLLVVSSAAGFVEYVKTHPENLEPILDGMSNRYKSEKDKYMEACATLAQYKKAVEAGGEIPAELKEKVDFYCKESELVTNEF